MGKALVIAEKPSAGMDMAKVLECTERHNGYVENENYVVTWAVGHLIGLKMPEEYDPKLKDWKMETLPLIFRGDNKLKILPGTAEQFETIKKLIHRPDVDYIINAGDAGREGYLIQSWIYRYAQNNKPVKILWASSLTVEALKKSFANLKEEDDFFKNLLQEAEARAEADYLMGINYSRVLTLTKSRDITLSYGRCQTPLLNLIVQRDLEIENFVSEPYFQLQAVYQQGFNGIRVTEDGKTFETKEQGEAEVIRSSITGEKAVVISCEKEHKTKKAPLLFNLAELQKEMGRKYKYTPDLTLDLAQRLYEVFKIISYPRTDSRCLSMDLYNEVEEHIQCCCFGKFQGVIEKISKNNIQADKSYFNDAKVTDHHALIPTINEHMEEEYKKLSEEEKNVFDAITLRFLAIFYPPYEYAVTTLLTRIGDVRFKSKGISINNYGYREIIKEKEKESEDQENIPIFNQGDSLEVEKVALLSKKTTPPPRYNVDSIISLMQKYGIGTSATMAEIINKLQNPKRQSIVMDKNGTYCSTPFGRKFIAVVPEDLKSPNLTKDIEEKLEKIENGTLTKDAFLNEIIEQIKQYIEAVKDDAGETLETELVAICPYCSKGIRRSRFNYTCETEDCLSIGNQICGKKIYASMIKDLVKDGKTNLICGFKGKTGRTFDAKLVLKNKKIEFEFTQKQRQR